ncbi:MAG: hypothetical protein MUF05_06210 [Candidatus Omnitrophica bacterium]|jgi:uncharacterized membrane protein|nr:hypothetical protein [Candidatus Omnitrophota bacterium]
MNQLKSIVVFSHAGCLLPFLIFFNLFFGLFFFNPLLWIQIELFLVLIFVLVTKIFTRKIFSNSPFSSGHPRSKGVIDVEAEVDPAEPDRKQLH